MNLMYIDKKCPKCGCFTNRGISVDGVIIKGNKILLIKRGSEPFKGYWGTPGGYVGWNETVEEAIIREVKEETGLDAISVKLVSYSSEPKRHPKQVINFVYLVEINGKVRVSDDAVDAKWFDLDHLPKDLAFDHFENIKKATSLSFK